ncbi:MAG: lipid-A-disaccharide synthase N-terminal domain-containing protein [Tepidisphaeraceae bacterium]|jgi:lipid-A-disaccharide synthase-like uncharacterized protein
MILPLAGTILGFHVKDADMPHSVLDWILLSVGIAGQAVFGGRFFLQWIHSERHGESKIPTSFWWLSVIGVLMTASYFSYKEEWVALLGNGPQLIPYTRNLILIYKKKPPIPTPDAPVEEPAAPAASVRP